MNIRDWLITAGAAAFLAGCMTDEEPRAAHQSSGAELAEALENHVRDGPSVTCVNSRDLRGNRTVGENHILFQGNGDRLWVNETRGSCPSLNFGRALRFRTTGTQFCQGEIAAVFDPTSGVEYGSCSLGEFTPYRRVR